MAIIVLAGQIDHTGLAVDAPVVHCSPAVTDGLHGDLLGVSEGLAVEGDGCGVGGGHGLGTGGRGCGNGSDCCVTGRLDRGRSVGVPLVLAHDCVRDVPIALLAFGPNELRTIVVAECGQDLWGGSRHGRTAPVHGICDRTCLSTGGLDALCGDLEGLLVTVTFLRILTEDAFYLTGHSHGLLVHVCPVNADELVGVYVLFLTVDGDSRSVCVAIHLDGGLIELGLGLFAGGGDGHVVGNGQGVDASVGTDLHGDAAVLTHIDVGDASVGDVHSGSVTQGDVVDASGVNSEAGSRRHADAVDLGIGTLYGDLRRSLRVDALEASRSRTLEDGVRLGVDARYRRIAGDDTDVLSALLVGGNGTLQGTGIHGNGMASASADDELLDDLDVLQEDIAVPH